MKSQTPISYSLGRILIALCAVIAEMAFPGQVGTDISRNDRHPRVRLHLIRYLRHTVLVAVDTLFPDPADRFLDVGDAD
jgi:hypothetical protein